MANYIDLKPKNQVSTGTSTTASVTQLIDTSAQYESLGVQVGDIVFNITDPEYSTVTEVTSETILTVDGSGFTLGDKYSVLRTSLTEVFPLKIENITRVTIENVGGVTRIAIALSEDSNSSGECRLNIKNLVSTQEDRNIIIDQFMRDINSALSSSYSPNVRSVSRLPNGNEYMFAEFTSL
tara:strand:- start:69 stop:611 length:543 start_codon:yes stop_codon:yes gene_type:complete